MDKWILSICDIKTHTHTHDIEHESDSQCSTSNINVFNNGKKKKKKKKNIKVQSLSKIDQTFIKQQSEKKQTLKESWLLSQNFLSISLSHTRT